MFRLLLITMLVGLTLATYNDQNQNRMARRPHHHNRHNRHHIVALDQMIKKKPAIHFLGRNFIGRALANQQGEQKFLKLNGHSERDVNGTIAFNKQGVYIDVNESKDGHFVVENQKKKIVGRVEMHSGTNKHLTSHKMKNGDQLINGYHVGSAELNVEQDLATRYPARYGKSQGPQKHMRMRVTQNHNTQGHIQITNVRPEANSEQAHYRYRRQADTPVETPCRENDCLNAVPF